MFPRWLFWLLFAAILGFVTGGSFVWGVLYTPPAANERPTEQTKHSNSAPTYTADQQENRDGALVTIPQIPANNLSTESAAQCQQCAAQQEKSWWDKFQTDPNATFALAVALFTLALVIVGAWQARRLRQTVEATEKASAETRRIGEAQIRAYVDIRAATVTFLRMTEGVALLDDVQPLVRITAKNTGQSPARNFVWQPTVHYLSFSDPIGNRYRRLGGNWRAIAGVGIPVGEEHSAGAMVTDMLLLRFLRENSPVTNALLLRVRIEFEYEDVFDRRITDEAYFMGTAAKIPDNGSAQTDFGPTQWQSQMRRIDRPNDWPPETEIGG